MRFKLFHKPHKPRVHPFLSKCIILQNILCAFLLSYFLSLSSTKGIQVALTGCSIKCGQQSAPTPMILTFPRRPLFSIYRCGHWGPEQWLPKVTELPCVTIIWYPPLCIVYGYSTQRNLPTFSSRRRLGSQWTIGPFTQYSDLMRKLSVMKCFQDPQCLDISLVSPMWVQFRHSSLPGELYFPLPSL